MNEPIPHSRIIPASVAWLARIGAALLLGICLIYIAAVAVVLTSGPRALMFEPMPRPLTWQDAR